MRSGGEYSFVPDCRRKDFVHDCWGLCLSLNGPCWDIPLVYKLRLFIFDGSLVFLSIDVLWFIQPILYSLFYKLKTLCTC